MRAVHNIARLNKAHRVIVSYIQHGNPDDGYVYENICPFCGTTLEYLEDDDELFPTEQDVVQRLHETMVSHVQICPRAGATPLQVYVTDKALRVEKKPEIM